MAYKLEIRPLAAMEVIEAFDWYELQREGLGAEFLDEVAQSRANEASGHAYFFHRRTSNPNFAVSPGSSLGKISSLVKA